MCLNCKQCRRRSRHRVQHAGGQPRQQIQRGGGAPQNGRGDIRTAAQGDTLQGRATPRRFLRTIRGKEYYNPQKNLQLSLLLWFIGAASFWGQLVVPLWWLPVLRPCFSASCGGWRAQPTIATATQLVFRRSSTFFFPSVKREKNTDVLKALDTYTRRDFLLVQL